MTAEYTISPLNEDNAREITTWRYSPPYDLYDLESRHLKGFLNPDYQYHQVLEKHGMLAGYCCFGIDDMKLLILITGDNPTELIPC